MACERECRCELHPGHILASGNEFLPHGLCAVSSVAHADNCASDGEAQTPAGAFVDEAWNCSATPGADPVHQAGCAWQRLQRIVAACFVRIPHQLL